MKIPHSFNRSLFVVLVLGGLALWPQMVAASGGPHTNCNTSEGYQALTNVTTGFDDTAFGGSALFSNTAGSDNTAIGCGALFSNIAGLANTAVGSRALYNNTPSFNPQTGSHNTAVGFQTLLSNTQGFENTAVGSQALYSNTIGIDNTATGVEALFSNSIGGGNTANGYQALRSNTTGGDNTAVGRLALFGNTTGSANTALGFEALFGYPPGPSAIYGRDNTAVGSSALRSNIQGNFNTAIGSRAARDLGGGGGARDNNTAVGYQALSRGDGYRNTAIGATALQYNTTGDGNTALGYAALLQNLTGSHNIAVGDFAGGSTGGSLNIDIGNVGANESNTIRIGTAGTQTATYVAGIFGATVTDGMPVLVDFNGHLGTAVSSERFKDDIKPIDKASEAILALKPVTFRYKADKKHTAQFGLIAEEVEKVNPKLVIRDSDGKPYSVRYDAVNAMLLNEFLKEYRKVERQQATIGQLRSNAAKQEATISELKKDVGVLTAQLKEQAAQIQKVSARLDVNERAPQMVSNR